MDFFLKHLFIGTEYQKKALLIQDSLNGLERNSSYKGTIPGTSKHPGSNLELEERKREKYPWWP